jgi:hypothetical protein
MSAQVTALHPTSPFSPQEEISFVSKEDRKIASLMKEVLDRKRDKMEQARKDRFTTKEGLANELTLIGGDFFSVGYLGFQAAQILRPSLASISAVAWTTLACGCIAGAVNIGVGFVSLVQGIQALKNGDRKLAFRLFLDFLGLFGIGIVMILASLAIRIGALSAIGSFFSANPWVLSLLFFAISIPVIVEIAGRIFNIQTGRDLASQLKGDINTLIRGTDAQNPLHLQSLIGRDESDLTLHNSLARKMEELQADMGVEAALEVFELMRLALLKEDTEEQFCLAKKKIEEWNSAQWVRLSQQALYAISFAASMFAVTPKLFPPAVNAGQTIALAGANLIPLFMDIFWPFKRNAPIVVPHVMDKEKF